MTQDHDLSYDATAYIASLKEITDRIAAREYALMDDQRFRAHHGLGLDRAVRDAATIKSEVAAANAKLDLVILEMRKVSKHRESVGRKTLGAVTTIGGIIGATIMHMLRVAQ